MITKKFSKSFDDALTQAYLFHSEFVADQALFGAFSPKFGITYADDFLALITAADDTKLNQDDLNMQTAITNDLDLKMESHKQHYQKLLLHVDFAWPGDVTKLKVFGKNLYDEARRVPAKMVNLLQDTYREANSTAYKAALIAAGFVQADITLLDTYADGLQNKLNEQQSFIRHSATRAEERAVAFNKVWDVMTQISGASKLIFTESPAKIGYYLLYPEGSGSEPLTAPENLTVDVATMIFSWDPVEGASEYQLEMAIGTEWEVIYTGADNFVNYVPPASGIRQYRALAKSGSNVSDYSLLMMYNHVAILPSPGYISLSVTNATTGELSILWESVNEATFYRLFHSQVALGAPAAGEYTLVGEYPTASYADAFPTNYRHWFHVVAGNSELLSTASDSVYVDMPLVP